MSPPLSDLTAFAAIARYRSFSRAAAEIGVSRSALSHTIRMLEQRLGFRLFNRTTRSVALTESGTELLSRLGPVLGDLETIFDDLAGKQGEPSGVLRINAPEVAVHLLMQRVVPEYLARFPQMHLDLAAEGRLVDIIAQGFDAGIRLAGSVPLDMIAVPFGDPVRFIAVASPDYLKTHTPPQKPEDLAGHRCIRQRLPSGKPYYLWEFERDGDVRKIEVPGVLTLDNINMMTEAAMAGMGIAYVPDIVAKEGLIQGSLVSVLDAWCPPVPGLCLYYSGRRHVPAGLKAFIDILRSRLPN